MILGEKPAAFRDHALTAMAGDLARPTLSAYSRRWHATQWPGRLSRNCGTSALHSGSLRIGQRVWKWQPDGGASGLGTSPCSMIRLRRAFGSGTGIAESSASV